MSSDESNGKNGIQTRALASAERTPLIVRPGPVTVSHEVDGSANVEAASGIKPSDNNATRRAQVDEHGHTAANQSIGLARGVCCAFGLGTLVFLVAVNMSMLTTTTSAIASELDAFDQTPWFTSSFLICMSSLGPLNGKLAAVFTPRSCIVAASVIIAVGELLCAWATTFEAFLIGRSVAGVGASGVFTISIIIVLELTGSRRKGIAIGCLNSGYTFGVAIGATAAGAFLPIIGWRALFWIQAPIALFAGLMLLLSIPAEFTAGKKDDSGHSICKKLLEIDYLGAITLTASLLLLLYALSSPKTIPISPLILSLMTTLIFVLVETYIAHDPIIPVSLLRHRGLLLTCLGTVGFMMARWCVLFYTPTYAIAVRQWTPSTGGAMLIPTNAGFAVGGLAVGLFHIKRKGSFWMPTVISYAMFPITLAVLGLLSHRDSSPAAFIATLFVNGCSAGAALNYSLAHVLHLTPPSGHYIATALNATFRGFAGSFGTSIGGGLFTRTLATSLTQHFAELGMERPSLVRRLLGSPALAGQLHGGEREVAIKGYEDGLQMLWYGAAVLSLAMVLVQAGTGWRGYQDKENGAWEERRALLHNDERSDREEAVRRDE